MEKKLRLDMIDKIVVKEKLRPLTRLARLIKDPIHAAPYYILASISHIKPYKISYSTMWGDKMTGYLPEANTFYYYGYCEANLTSFLLRYLSEGMTVIDVGAHIGFYTMLSSHLVGEKGYVYSFEPTPWTYDLLLKNSKSYKNVKTINAGVSDVDGEVTFADYGPGYGAYNSASSEGTMLKFKPEKIVTRTINLDSFINKNNITPDFIKLDAEGFEHKILNGMIETINNIRPVITLEMAGGEQWSENCKKSSSILYSAGYDSYEMTVDGFIKKCEIKPPYTYTNILFIPKEKVGTIGSNLLK